MHTNERPRKKGKASGPLGQVNWKWICTITVLSFLISVSMSYISSEALKNVGNILAFVILLIFIAIGIVFDIVGMAATSATEKEFHSMAAKKVSGAKEAVWLSRNASKVSSICNDVVGDISGIISGATGAIDGWHGFFPSACYFSGHHGAYCSVDNRRKSDWQGIWYWI